MGLLLVYLDTAGMRCEVELDHHQREEWTVGRLGSNSHIELDHDSVSRQHARLVWRGQWFVEDLGSRNGTYVDHQKMQMASMPVRVGAKLRFGRVPIEVHELSQSPAEVPSAEASPMEVLQIAYETRKQEISSLRVQLEQARADLAERDEEITFLKHENENLREQLRAPGGLEPWSEPPPSPDTMNELPAYTAPSPNASHEDAVNAKLNRALEMLERLLLKSS